MRKGFLSTIRIISAVFVTLALVLVLANEAGAEEPDEVVALIEKGDGVYIPNSRSDEFDMAELREAMADAISRGLDIAVIAPTDPFPNNEAFALRVRQAGELDIVISFGVEGDFEASVASDVPDADPGRARLAAATRPTPETAVATYLTDLQTKPVVETPSVAGTLLKYAIILILILAAAVVLETFFRRRKAIARAERAARDAAANVKKEKATAT